MHMPNRLRVLVASPLGHVVAAPLESALDSAHIAVATDEDEFVRSVVGNVRFDVVVSDLIWNRPEMEWTFDGLDAIGILAEHDRHAPVILATQGYGLEQDHLDEARLRNEVVGVIAKSDGFATLMNSIRAAALGQSVAEKVEPPRRKPLYELLTGQRGHTAGRLAGAIASGNASDGASLARAAKVSPNTANKVTSHYLGPIIEARGEHPAASPMTQAAVFRWCGLHARYLISWCRRHGHPDVLAPMP
ncbi:response regulator [Gordonia paraffinivorans]|uniref:response regulator n=1 Tax=Gordonia paraffinivorans TaxID=175628 RepID=UPI000D608C62|nr:response regulator [Gordonia paraffinivorans]PWD43688.1 response regulator [Gordonia paraffinivorans]